MLTPACGGTPGGSISRHPIRAYGPGLSDFPLDPLHACGLTA